MGCPNITDRKFIFCPRLSEYSLNHLIVQCCFCGRFVGACCPDNTFGGDLSEEFKDPCHNLQLVFTDGACARNGQVDAMSGLGITLGSDELSWSIPVSEEMDLGASRTNQRAELLAAIEGLKKLHEQNNRSPPGHTTRFTRHEETNYVVVTDSEYVVKGITEWFPSWKRRNWRTADGKRPTNLDLFLKLDEYTISLEQQRVAVGFWRVPRAYNHKADALAKRAAEVA